MSIYAAQELAGRHRWFCSYFPGRRVLLIHAIDGIEVNRSCSVDANGWDSLRGRRRAEPRYDYYRANRQEGLVALPFGIPQPAMFSLATQEMILTCHQYYG